MSKHPYRLVRRGLGWGLRGLWGAVKVVLVTTAFGVALFAVSGREITLPDRITQRIETRLEAVMAGGALEIDRTRFAIGPDLSPVVLLHDLVVSDAAGLPLAELAEVAIRLSAGHALGGQLHPTGVELSGVVLSLRREPDGRFDLSLETGEGPLSPTGSFADILNGVEAAFDAPLLSHIRSIAVRDLTFEYEDVRAGRFWVASGANAVLERDGEKTEMRLGFDLDSGTDQIARGELTISAFRETSRAVLSARMSGLPASDFATQSPALAWLSVIEAPVSGALRAELDDDGTLHTMNGTLDIDAGVLQPTPEAEPVEFRSGRAYFGYDPAAGRVRFDEFSVETDALTLRAEGQGYLRDMDGGWPRTMLGQLRFTSITANPGAMFTAPVAFDGGALDLRLRFDPLTVSIGQMVLFGGDTHLVGKGRITAGPQGWQAALDMTAARLAVEDAAALWPDRFAPQTRKWVTENVQSGVLHNVAAFLRATPGQEPLGALAFRFDDATVRYVKTLPVITGASGFASIHDHAFSLTVENGHVVAPNGGRLDVTDSTFGVADTRAEPERLDADLRLRGDIPALLSLLDAPPLEILQRAGRTPDIADGEADVTARLGLDLIRGLKATDVDFQAEVMLRDVTSDKIIGGRRLQADMLSLRGSNEGVEISGAVRLGQATGLVAWIQAFDTDTEGRSRIEGTVDLSQAFLDEFGISLPPGSVEGMATGRVEIDLGPDAPPRFRLQSDLSGVQVRLPPLGWSKAADQTASLLVEGELGARPRIEALRLEAGGLEAEGTVTLHEDGTLDEMRFSRIRAGDWLDAPVVLTGRGRGQPPDIQITGGRMDIRGAAGLGQGGGGGGGTSTPVSAALDRVTVSDNVVLSDFRGNFVLGAGVAGGFSATLNDAARITGELVPQSGRSAIRVRSDDAGAVLGAIGILGRARGGTLDLVLAPLERKGVLDGQLRITDGFRVRGAPALADLLNAISVIGLLEQLNGSGLAFVSADARFRLTPEQVVISRASASGPSLGVSLNGIYDLAGKQLDIQGVLSPVYLVNGIGSLFTRPGEGLFGFNFSLRGAVSDPQATVNPLSILTPGMFREIFQRPPPELPE